MTRRSRSAAASPKKSARKAASPSTAAAAPAEDTAAIAVTLSVETVLWTAVIGFAFGLRLASLGHLPFSVAEASRAFGAWMVSKGHVPDGWTGDLGAAFTAHLFRIFGPGETVARVIPALSGCALVASFWFAKRYFGRGSALLAGGLIAFSPLALDASRSAFGFALGGFLSMVMVLSLLAYLEERRRLAVGVFAGAAGLALGSDPIAVSTLLALVAFIAIEAAWRQDGAVTQAIATLRKSRDHWQPAAGSLAVAVVLGVVQFGTDIDRLSLPGVRQWADMFSLPGDGLPRLYQLSLLIGYEWPLLVAGGAAYLVYAYRWAARSGADALVHRLLIVWATVAIIVVALATNRQSGQLLALLVPLALLAAALIEEEASTVNWSLLKRWWPAVALALVLTAYAVIQVSRWAREGNQIGADQRIFMVMALIGAMAIVVGAVYYWGRNGLVVALPFGAALALPFLIHSSLSIGFGEGAEFAVYSRFAPRAEQFATAAVAEARRRRAPVAVDHPLAEALGWYLRDGGVVFQGPPSGSPLVTVSGAPTPPGYTPLGSGWRVGDAWAPSEIDLKGTWKWLAERDPYGNLSSIEVQILVPTQ